MTCIVCKEAHKYKCIECSAGYCSVICYKTHKESCSKPPKGLAEPAAEQRAAEPATTSNNFKLDPDFERWLEDPDLRSLIGQPALQHHLKVIADIIQDARLSGESSGEGRRAVAVKKLRELRMGGREKNEAVEEFVRLVLGHMQLGEAGQVDDN